MYLRRRQINNFSKVILLPHWEILTDDVNNSRNFELQKSGLGRCLYYFSCINQSSLKGGYFLRVQRSVCGIPDSIC